MDALRDGEFSEAELAYLNSGGQNPLPAEPAPEPVSTEAEPVAEVQSEPEAEPAPADADPDVIEDGDETHKGRKVGYSAYLRKKAEVEAARNEREELRTQLEASKREQAVQNARIEERFKLWQQSQQQAAPKPPEPAAPPNPEEDPMAALRWQNERLAQLEQHTAQSAEQTRQTQLISQLDQAYRADNFQAKQEVPEYPEAYNYLVQREQQRIRIQNPHFTQQQVNAAIEQGERQLAAAAFQRGQRPAAMILQMAATYGWTPRAAAPQEAPQPDASAEQAKIDAAARGQAQNRTLSTAGRPGGSTAMTLDRFMAMSDDEARDWTAKNPDGLAKLSGVR